MNRIDKTGLMCLLGMIAWSIMCVKSVNPIWFDMIWTFSILWLIYWYHENRKEQEKKCLKK